MPRYVALIRFGPWDRGDEFESVDPLHARMAEKGRLREVPDGPSPEERGEER